MLSMIAFCICSLAAILTLINGDWVWFIIDVIFAASNAKSAFEWLKSQR